MCKKHDADGYKRALQDVLQRGYSFIDGMQQELNKIKDDPDKENERNALNHSAFYINDVMHSASDKALDLFPINNHPFIKGCKEKFLEAKKANLINPCSCKECK